MISAELENIAIRNRSSFYVGNFCGPYFKRSLHYHPENELILITKGYGTRMVGDHFERYQAGDLVLLGGNLPHAWISDPSFSTDIDMTACESVYIQFRKSVFGTHFIDMPELESIRIILDKSRQGLKIEGDQRTEIEHQMLSISMLSPIEQLLALIRLLDMIYHSKYRTLASKNYIQQGIFRSKKMTQIHAFMVQNFKHDIDLEKCAAHAKMTPTSFCRFFKKQTNVTFSVYLNYLRINFAQKLLRNTELPIKEIAFECGYASIAYFNQKFKKMTGMSPKEFRNHETAEEY